MTRHEDSAPSGTVPPVSRRRSRIAWWPDALLTLLVGLVSVLIAMWAMGIRPSNLGVPWGEGDLLAVYAYAENLSRGHWFLINPDLGYPGFQDHGHFPVTDLLSIAQIALLAVLTQSPVLAVNLFTLGTFFTVATAFYLVLRWESVTRPFAAVIAIAFAVLPWHLERAAGHIFLASYMSIPLALFLVGLVARRRLERTRGKWVLATAIVAAIAVGANGVYYALMTTMLMGVVLLVTALWPRISLPGWRTILVTVLVPATTIGAVLLNAASTSTASIGESVVRSPSEAYLYGGNTATLFFPAPTTLSGTILSRFLNLGFPNIGNNLEGHALLSSAGVLAILLTCGVAALRWSTLSAVDPRGAIGRASFWPGLFLLTTAFFAVGGLGALFSHWISSDIRAWGRYSVFVVGIAFLVTGIVLTVWRQSRRRTLRIGSVVLGLGLAVSVIADLSTGAHRMPVEWGRALHLELDEYVAAVEEHTADGCPVLELPLTLFPEGDVINRMTLYSHLWPYVYSDDLRWSYGAMKGTPLGDWGMDARDDPEELLVRAREAGFCGLQVDIWAYANLAEAVDAQGAFGNPDIVSRSGRWAFFDLTGPQSDEYSVAPDSGFTLAVEPTSLPVTWWMVDDQASLRVEGTPGSQVQVDLALASTPCGPVTVSVDGTMVSVAGSHQYSAQVELDEEGMGSIPITAASEPCTIEGEAAPVWLGLAGPQWAPTVPDSQP